MNEVKGETSVLNAVLDLIEEALVITDGEGVVIRANLAFYTLTGLDARQVLGRPLNHTGEGANPRIGGENFPTVLELGRAGECVLSPIPIDSGGKNAGRAVKVRPLQLDTGVEKREGFDQLTDLPNRNLFLDRVEQTLHQSRRVAKSAAVVMVGIDHFSLVNQGMGEEAGDHLLRELAQRLRRCVRSSDTVARMEGDRFAFCMQITNSSDSVTVAEKVLRSFEKPFIFDQGEEVAITCSLGVSIYPNDGEDAEELVKNATIAMGHAKKSGRNRHQFFASEMNSRAKHRLDIESGLRRALANNELLLHYQPKINVENGRVAGLEALVRWQDPGKGLISPGLFIPVAEESGLIERIGHWVLVEACRCVRGWQREGLPPVKASVNVSVRQFRNPDFVAIVDKILKDSDLDPKWLELEITESMLMGDMDAMVKRMEELRNLGLSLSIDDFGTGYSSLSYLGRFPITTLKIDRAFISDVQTNPHTAEIARAIIGLSKGLNLEVVAEGAEVKEHIDFLRENGCTVVQGFFYSKPLPAEDFAEMLRAQP